MMLVSKQSVLSIMATSTKHACHFSLLFNVMSPNRDRWLIYRKACMKINPFIGYQGLLGNLINNNLYHLVGVLTKDQSEGLTISCGPS